MKLSTQKHMCSHSSKKTFTLIEMLIVIVIIGILAAALVPRLISVQGRARDTKRKADLKQIYDANEIYKLDNSYYVRAGACAYNTPGCHVRSHWSTGGAVWIIGLTGYMLPLPVDPINTADNHYSYGNVFDYANVVGVMSYEMRATLENTLDPARCGVRIYKNILNGDACINLLTGGSQAYQFSPHSIKLLP